jgi:hypothetical protein
MHTLSTRAQEVLQTKVVLMRMPSKHGPFRRCIALMTAAHQRACCSGHEQWPYNLLQHANCFEADPHPCAYLQHTFSHCSAAGLTCKPSYSSAHYAVYQHVLQGPVCCSAALSHKLCDL